jgi:hypothetical protein
MQAAEEPEHKKNDHYQAQSATEPGATVPAVPVIPAATAEQQNDHDNDQNQTHLAPSFSTRGSALDRSEP